MTLFVIYLWNDSRKYVVKYTNAMCLLIIRFVYFVKMFVLWIVYKCAIFTCIGMLQAELDVIPKVVAMYDYTML